jgi:hypothetical protein
MRLALGWLLVLLSPPIPALGQAAHVDDEGDASTVRTVLSRQSYPWYDGQTDHIVPLVADPRSWPRRVGDRVESFFKWLEGLFGRSGPSTSRAGMARLGRVLTSALFVASGVILLILLWRLWRDHEPGNVAGVACGDQVGFAARIAGLPGGTSLEGIDPWAEATRRRTAGDRSGVVIWIFLAQLTALQKVGRIRPIPGRTARQYVVGLEDASLRRDLEASLGVFEDVYYGHRVPTPESIESVWARAEAVRSRLLAAAEET